MAVKRWPLILSLMTLALLCQSLASTAHEAQKGHPGKSPSQHHERRESRPMNKDILGSFRNRKLISTQVKKVRGGVRPGPRIKTSAAVQARQMPSFSRASLCFSTLIGLLML
ncbi:uncharacterized protein J3R85_010756 [Psidium guajava]|nr:uncharacterized protein J3R85_010756 [Psidium guajava]